MHILKQCLLMAAINGFVYANEYYIPERFQAGQVIEHIILISDVDGVVRDCVEGTADPRVIEAVKTLLESKKVEVAFMSGTPVDNDLTLEPWRRGNVPLNKVFGSAFEKELSEDRVTVYGVLGGHKMRGDGACEVVDEYSPTISAELGTLLIEAFLKEVLYQGNLAEKQTAAELQVELKSLDFTNCKPSSSATALEFASIIEKIREYLDPNFRLISNGASIETHTSNPPWSTQLFLQWLQEEMDLPQHHVSTLSREQKQLATGFAKRGDLGFNYLLISKTNKGLAAKKHIEEKLKQFPQALVVTIGDTQVDFPMHQNAHLAFHVGLEGVWLNNALSHCVMVRNAKGEDSQHVEGTLKVLELLKDAVGQSFFDLKYIPKQDSFERWDYYSVKEMQ